MLEHKRVEHVLMTADSLGGVWTYALELIGGLGEKGIRVSLATMGAALREEQIAQAAALDNLQIFQSNWKLEWEPSPWDDVDAAGRWLLELERKLEPDVVHLNGYIHAALPWNAPVLSVAHSCVLSWWAAVRSGPLDPCFAEYERRVRAALQHVDTVIAPSAWMLGEVRRHYRYWKSAQVIPNARTLAVADTPQKEDIIFTSGRLWDEAKNVASLRETASTLRWPIYVAGDDRSPSGERSSFPGLKMLGRLSNSDVTNWCSKASIYVSPAFYEPFGLSVLEAALCGCALVLSDIPSFREIWGNAAIFVSPDSPPAIGNALRVLTESPDLRERYAARARERARRYSTGAMVRAYLGVYERLAQRPAVESSCA
jgi:glycosyltransferase involved in cell wall biosynthesis